MRGQAAANRTPAGAAHRVKRCCTLAAGIIWLSASATFAASFDCTKAATRDEKLICSNQTLSVLDDELGRVYSRSMRDVPDPAELRHSQVDWLEKRKACTDAACIVAAYKRRLAELAGAPLRPIPEREVRTQCIMGAWSGERRSCTVSAVKKLGNVGDLAIHAVSYCLSTATRKPDLKNCQNKAVLVFSQKPGDKNWELQVSYDDVRHEEPALTPDGVALHQHGAASILYIPARLDGTGNINVSRHYAWNNKRWELIDTETWIAELRKRLPPGSEFWKGFWYDLKTLTSHVGVYRKGDANCCPSGGMARAELALSGTRFVLKAVTLEKERDAEQRDASAIFGSAGVAAPGYKTPFAADLDGDGKPDSVYLLSLTAQNKPAPAESGVTFENPWSGKARNTRTGGLAIGVQLASGARYVLHDDEFFASPIWRQAKLPLTITRRGSSEHRGFARQSNAVRHDIIVLGTEAGIDIALYWDGKRFALFWPREIP